MAKQLCIDLDELDRTIKTYKEITTQFMTVIDQANTAMKILEESKWKSAASEAFFETYSTNWVKAFDDHLKSLEFLTEQLGNAQEQYEDIHDEIDRMATAVRGAM